MHSCRWSILSWSGALRKGSPRLLDVLLSPFEWRRVLSCVGTYVGDFVAVCSGSVVCLTVSRTVVTADASASAAGDVKDVARKHRQDFGHVL